MEAYNVIRWHQKVFKWGWLTLGNCFWDTSPSKRTSYPYVYEFWRSELSTPRWSAIISHSKGSSKDIRGLYTIFYFLIVLISERSLPLQKDSSQGRVLLLTQFEILEANSHEICTLGAPSPKFVVLNFGSVVWGFVMVFGLLFLLALLIVMKVLQQQLQNL